MSIDILSLQIQMERDVVLARQRARQIAALLGFDGQDQTRIATAVSEIARNAFRYAGSGRIAFLVEDGAPQLYLIRVSDKGPGIARLGDILRGQYRSRSGLGMGILGAQRLMDHFRIDAPPGMGTTVELGKKLTHRTAPVTLQEIGTIADELARSTPEDPLQEVLRQNQELARALDELRTRQEELARLNRELEDTNRGVVALYAELDERADSLRRASEVKSNFLSNMSHEFRTPLNSMLTLSRMLLDRIDGELTEEQEKQVTYIRRSAEGLAEMVNDLLDMAKIEAGKIQVRPTDFTVEKLFGALRGMLKPLVSDNHSVALIFDEPEGIPPLYTDEGKISQILRNFISNALKFTERGEIRVGARMASDGLVVFAVADTGIGIAPEDQERIFQEYAQVDGPRQANAKGTGLGLPLSNKLAQLLGGSICLQSDPGVGSTFFAGIPIHYGGPEEAVFVPEVTRVADPARRPVLVVEDNPEALFLYEKFLRGTPFQVMPARTVAEARQILDELRPMAIILDILLEAENTWRFLAELKDDPKTREIPVLVISIVKDREKARLLGADDYCHKPVARDWLVGRLALLTKLGAPQSLLTIDDDEVHRYLLRGYLGNIGFNVLECERGADGVFLARQEQPQAIFLDLNMPEMDGFTVLERLKTDPVTREIPVIIATSKTLSATEHERLGAHAAAILDKSNLSREILLSTLRQALNREETTRG